MLILVKISALIVYTGRLWKRRDLPKREISEANTKRSNNQPRSQGSLLTTDRGSCRDL